jgi:hypothetical protein
VLIGFFTPYTARFWPNSDIRSLVLAWHFEDEWRTLLEMAEKTSYTHIIWSNNGISKAGVRSNDNIDWDSNPDISTLIDTAKNYGMEALILIRLRDHWTIDGPGDSWVKYSETGHAKLIRINSYYQFSNTGEGTVCSRELIEASDFGRCYLVLFDNWVLQKEWITDDYPLYSNGET